MKILKARRVATIAFTARDTEKAAVLREWNQNFVLPGSLDEAGCIIDASVAKEVPDAPLS